MTFLGLLHTKQTPGYILFATPIVQAATCVDWGLRQITSAMMITLPPWMFVAIMVAGRLMLDVCLQTTLRHRHDLLWARHHVLLSTKHLLVSFAGMLLCEHMV